MQFIIHGFAIFLSLLPDIRVNLTFKFKYIDSENMRVIRFILTMLILVLFTDVSGQWIPDPLISGGPISKIRHLGDDIFILSSENLFKSNDLGQTWKFLSGIPETINDFDVNGQTGLIVAMTGLYNKIYISQNAGESWELKGEADGDFILLTEKSIFSYHISLYRSNNGGQNWKNVFQRPGTPGITNELATIGDTLFLATGFQNVGYGLQRSNDNGDTWNRVGLPGSPDRIYKVKSFDSLVYVSVRGSNGTYSIKSDDYGESWTNIGEVAPGITEWNDFTNSGDTLVVCDYGKVRISYNGGNQWSALNLPQFENWNPVSALLLKGTHLFIGTQNGIYYSSDMGNHWEKRSDGIYSGQFWFYYKKTIDNVYMVRDASLFKKNVNIFDRITLPSTNELGNVHTADDLLLVTHYDNSGNAGTLFDHYASLDGGLTYLKMDLPRDKWLSGILHSNDQYVLSMDGGIYRSNDAISWEKIYSLENQYVRIQQLSKLNNEIFGLIYGLVSSKDNGESWDQILGTPLDTLSIRSISSSSRYLYLTWYYEKEISYNNYRTASGVYRYDGLEWELINHNQSPWQQLYVDNTFVSLLSNESILFSNDSGDSFKNFRNGFNSNRIEPSEIVTFQDSVFLVLDAGGAWKRDLDGMDFTPLPTPYNLKGSYDGQSVTLSWEAESANNDGFIIERSPSHFKEYDRVESESMEYTDADSNLSYERPSITYRIFSFDYEGWSLPSESFTINYFTYIETLDFNKLEIFPNPVEHELYVKFDDHQPVALIIYDLFGSVLKPEMVRLENNTIRIDLKSIPKQLLILGATFSDGTTEHYRIVRY